MGNHSIPNTWRFWNQVADFPPDFPLPGSVFRDNLLLCLYVVLSFFFLWQQYVQQAIQQWDPQQCSQSVGMEPAVFWGFIMIYMQRMIGVSRYCFGLLKPEKIPMVRTIWWSFRIFEASHFM
jgi:hypothetical protein